MKGLGLFGKLIFLLNSVFALLLLLSLLIPYLPPSQFPLLSLLSLVVPPLLLVNVLFMIFWLVLLKKQMLLSLFVLIACFVQFNSFYRLPLSKDGETKHKDLKVMSYNVRIFNQYGFIKDAGISKKIEALIASEDPDVLSFQEYHTKNTISFSKYPYKYIQLKGKSSSFGQAIYSKYPIIDKGNLDFKDTGNNAIYADIVKNQDTLRVYNIHLESMQLNPEDADFTQEASKRLLRRIATSFKVQQGQAMSISLHKKSSPYKVILTGDLNNTAFSYVYREIKDDMKDAFAETGQGLGTTFNFRRIPLRIDFIFTDKSFNVDSFKTHKEVFSDHFPVTASLSWD